MERYLKTILPVIALFFLRRAFTPKITAEDVAAAGSRPAHSYQFEVTGALAQKILDTRLSEDALTLIALAALFFSAVVGYVCDILLDDRAFGPKVNGVLCFLGSAIAVLGWIFVAPKAYVGNPSSILIVSSVGAVLFLLLFAILKAALISRFDEVASGARPVRLSSRGGPSESRLNAVTSRRR